MKERDGRLKSCFLSLSRKIREIEKRKEQGDAAEQRESVLAKNSMENNVRDSVQGNDGNNAQNPIQNPAQNTTGNMSGSVDSYSGVHGENSENATEIQIEESSIEERNCPTACRKRTTQSKKRLNEW